MLVLSESLYVETHCKLFDVTFNNVDTFYTATRQKSRAYSGLVRSNTTVPEAGPSPPVLRLAWRSPLQNQKPSTSPVSWNTSAKSVQCWTLPGVIRVSPGIGMSRKSAWAVNPQPPWA